MISRCAQCCNVRKNNVLFFFSYYYSGYGSQAVSSNTLSSDDSMSLRSISVDDTPDTEIGPSKIGAEELKKVASSVAVDLTKAAAATNTKAVADASNQSSSSADLLSPPDISLTSISPGDETDATVTITPSSATITPSQSSEMGMLGSREECMLSNTRRDLF